MRSLAKFYGQYVDRHMNLKFMRCVSGREWEIRQSVIIKNKLMSVFNASVLLLTMINNRTDTWKIDVNFLNFEPILSDHVSQVTMTTFRGTCTCNSMKSLFFVLPITILKHQFTLLTILHLLTLHYNTCVMPKITLEPNTYRT